MAHRSWRHRAWQFAIAHCVGGQAPVWLLHGAPSDYHGWCRLLGVESAQGSTVGLDLGIRHRGFASKSVFANSDATRAVATNRPVAGNPLAGMVRTLVNPQPTKAGRLTGETLRWYLHFRTSIAVRPMKAKLSRT